MAEHDRSAHAERQALLKVLRQLKNDWNLSEALMHWGSQNADVGLNRDVSRRQWMC